MTSVDLKQCILQATKDAIGKNKQCRKTVKGLPCKPWYDAECKEARKSLKKLTGEAYIQAEKQYHALRRKKRSNYVVAKEEMDAHMMAKNPKKTWDEMKNTKRR